MLARTFKNANVGGAGTRVSAPRRFAADRIRAMLCAIPHDDPAAMTPTEEPTRDEIAALRGLALLEFGTSWCGHCRAAQGPIADALAAHPNVRRIKVEDGPGRLLGRAFRVKLWPTLVFLRDGSEVDRLVRPSGRAPIADALARIDFE